MTGVFSCPALARVQDHPWYVPGRRSPGCLLSIGAAVQVPRGHALSAAHSAPLYAAELVVQGRDLHSCAPASRSLRKLYAAGLTRGHGWCHHCGMQMRYEYETGPDRNSGTGRLPSDYQEVSVQMMTPGDANALGWSYDEAMAARDAVQDERTAALDALAAENGIMRGDGPEVPVWSIWA